MCETANQLSISSHMVVYMACKMRCRWLTFRRCFVYCVHYPEIGHFEIKKKKPGWTPSCLIRKTLFSGTLFIVSGWRKRVWKTVLFRFSHLFRVFWLSFAPGFRAATNESQKTRNKTVFHTRLRHPETINSVPLNSVLRIKQIGV